MTIKHKEVLPMYNRESLKRKIAKEGLSKTIQFLKSDALPSYIKEAQTEDQVFDENGHLCLDFLSL